jgi:hypothetical protein
MFLIVSSYYSFIWINLESFSNSNSDDWSTLIVIGDSAGDT